MTKTYILITGNDGIILEMYSQCSKKDAIRSVREYYFPESYNNNIWNNFFILSEKAFKFFITGKLYKEIIEMLKINNKEMRGHKVCVMIRENEWCDDDGGGAWPVVDLYIFDKIIDFNCIDGIRTHENE